MNKLTTIIMAMGVASAMAANAGVSVTSDFASAYVFRGYTFNDGPVIQPGISASGLGIPESYGSATVGAWGNINVNDEYNGSSYGSQFSEVDWYGSYSLPSIVDGLGLSVGYTEYTYPGSAPANADKELNVGASYSIAGVNLGATVFKLVGGAYTGDTWYQVAANYGYELAKGLTATVAADARFVDSVGGESGFNDYTVGGSVSYALSDVWTIGAGITYIGQGDDEVLADVVDGSGIAGYDTDVVGKLTLAASF